MQIAQVLSGYTLGAADLLRRAMGKKKPEEMAQQRNVFTEGAVANGVNERLATQIFDLIEKFAGYGFNRSHSAGYALLSYQTAWLKAHHPAAFMSAVLSTEMDNTDKVVTLIDECGQLGLAVLAPDINESEYGFTVADAEQIRYGLGAIRGVGQSAIEMISAVRVEGGPFMDLADLCRRIDLHKANRRVLEALIKAGALDALGASRAALMAQLPHAVKLAEQHGRAETTGQEDLFGLGGGDAPVVVPLPVPDAAVIEWGEQERLSGEKETLGLYLTGHPIQRYETELACFVSGKIAALAEEVGEGGSANGSDDPKERWRNRGNQKNVTLAGLVVDLKKRNGRLALTLDDRSGRVELPLFEDVAARYRNIVTRDQLLVVEGKISFDEFSGGYRIAQKQMYDIAQAREAWGRRIEIDWRGADADPSFATRLKETLEPYRRGGCPVWVNYRGWSAGVPVDLGAQWRVRPEDALFERLVALVGAGNVRMIYDGGPVAMGAA